MHVVYGYDHVPRQLRGASIAIGNFDGVHRGHQALLQTAKRSALTTTMQLAGALIFEPNPRQFFQPERPHFALTSLPQRLDLLRRHGLDLTIVLNFDASFANMTANEFIERVLVAGLGVSHVVVGYDFHFGRGRTGTPDQLREAGDSYGFGVSIIEQIADQGEVISSSAIRAELGQGDVEGAAKMLGHWWRVRGRVRSGARRGTGLGYPTANIGLLPGTALAHGIYAVRVYIGAAVHNGAAYYGTRPTFDDGAAVLETFLFDFDDDIYGREIEIEFIGRVRGDRKFNDSDGLIAQMERDVAQARARLASLTEHDPYAYPGSPA